MLCRNQQENSICMHFHVISWRHFLLTYLGTKRSIEAHFIKAVCAKFKNNRRWFAYQSQTLYILYAGTDKKLERRRFTQRDN